MKKKLSLFQLKLDLPKNNKEKPKKFWPYLLWNEKNEEE